MNKIIKGLLAKHQIYIKTFSSGQFPAYVFISIFSTNSQQ